MEEIRKQNYSLAPSKYISFIDRDLQIDYSSEIVKIQSEMKKIVHAEKEALEEIEKAFRGIGYGVD